MKRILITFSLSLSLLIGGCSWQDVELRLLELEAKLGNADAQSDLGAMYYNGDGVTQDYVRAHILD